MSSDKEKEYQREYRKKNAARIKAKRAEWKMRNKEHLAESGKEYRARNKEKMAAYLKQYREKNRKEILAKSKEKWGRNRDKYNARRRKYAEEHREELRIRNKEYREKNAARLREYSKTSQSRRRESAYAYLKARRAANPVLALRERVRQNIRQCLRRKGKKKTCRTYQILGCSQEELFNHISSKFLQMYGYAMPPGGVGLDIHHIIPIYTAKTEEDIIKLNHYTNLIALTREDHKAIHFGEGGIQWQATL